MNQDGTVSLSELPGIVGNGQCMGCGFCTVNLPDPDGKLGPDGVLSYEWLPEEEHWGPVLTPKGRDDTTGSRRICPGASMNMRKLAQDTFGKQPLDAMVGEALRIASGYATDENVRQKAASGGVATALGRFLFRTDQIDAFYCTAGLSPRSGHGFVARNAEELMPAVGSHYHPVAFGDALQELANDTSRFAFVGLPCEIAAMRNLMRQRPDIQARCILLIGLFCGGINRFSGIARYLKRFSIEPLAVNTIDYRDGTWPGQIAVSVAGEESTRHVPRIRNNSRWNILHYMISFQGYWMLPRCRICPDQISDFADIALGDPHLARFKTKASQGVSAVVARTETGLALLESAEANGDVILGELSRDELVKSQGYTLENRRHAPVYASMASRLGMTPPDIKVYDGLEKPISPHQHVYAFVDLAKIRFRKVGWLMPLYLPLQIFEYLFLTLSPRLILGRMMKLLSNR